MSRKINYTTIPRDGLLGEWFLDGNANNISGNGNNGTETDITYVGTDVGYVNQYASFNGSSSYIDTNYVLGGNSSTINLFYTHTVDGKDQTFILSQGYKNVVEGRMGLEIKDDNTLFLFQNSNGVIQISSHPLIVGKTYMITIVRYSQNLWELYVNTVSQGTDTGGKALSNESILLMKLTNKYREGNIGLVRVYNKALSQQEINNLYQEGLRRFGPTRGQKNNNIFIGSLLNLEKEKKVEYSKPQFDGKYYDQARGGAQGFPINDVVDYQIGKINVMSFNGSDSGVYTYDVIGAKNITICGRFKYNSYTQTSNNGGLDFTTSKSDDYNRISIRVDNDDNYWLFDIVGTSYNENSRITLTPKPDLGVWNFVGATYDYDNDIFTAYINGVQIGQNTGINFKLDDGHKELKIAHGTNNSGSNFIFADVDIGLPIIYQRILSPEEMQQLYYLQKGNFIN